MEEQRVVRAGVSDEPLHCSDHVVSRRDLSWVRRVVCEHDDVVLLITPLCAKESLHVVRIVNASFQFCRLSKVVYTNLSMATHHNPASQDKTRRDEL